MKLQRCDIGDWRRYRHPKSKSIIAVAATPKGGARLIPGWSSGFSTPVSRDQAAKMMKEARNG